MIDTPEMAVITAIGLDHTAELGDTLGKIASAKGGIIKACGDVVIYPQAEEAEIVLKQMAEEKYCHVFQPDFSAITPVSETLSGQTFDYGKYHGLKIPMAGNYQQRNAAVVVTVCERLAAKGWHITEQNIRDGLADTAGEGASKYFPRSLLSLWTVPTIRTASGQQRRVCANISQTAESFSSSASALIRMFLI